MRRLYVIPALLLLALSLLPAAGTQAQDARCFPETGFCISGPIRRYWEQNGGLPVFGYPTTPLQTETVEGWSGPVQWFERDRLEDHTNENKGVLAGRLGVERLSQQGRPWQFRPLGAAQPGCRAFAETGYAMCGGFLTYWERNGGLARFGFPVTDERDEVIEGRTYRVQYFERRRMELHPEFGAGTVLLGLLGNEVRGGGSPTPPPPTPTPIPVSQQIRIDEPSENGVISSPVRVSGRTTRVPASGSLSYRVSEPNGAELGSGTVPVGRLPSGEGSFSTYIAYQAPIGNTVIFELAERDQRSGAVIARAQRTVRYEPTRAQQITLDRPAAGARVGTRIQLSGRTAIFPSEGDLILNVYDSRRSLLIAFPFAVQGAPGQPSTFFVEFDIPDQRGNPVAIEVLDTNARGDILARTSVTVSAGTSPYPAP